LYGRALSIGISPIVTIDIVKSFITWCDKSGYEWTVNRFKSVKQDIINSVALGVKPSSTWISKNSRGNFTGSFGYLIRYANNSSKCLHRVLTLINIFHTVVSDGLIPSQIDKFVTAVTTSSDPTPKEYIDLINKSMRKFRTNKVPLAADPFITHAPFTDNRESRALREVIDFFSTREGIEFIKNHYEVLYPLNSIFGFDGPRFTGKPPYIGSVHCTQNVGLKARFFASPHLWLQHCLSPLGDMIYDVVKELPWDCTFQQDKPDDIIKSHLLHGKMAWSFDLSSATDRFPFDLQLTALESLLSHPISKKYISFYRAIQQMPYNFYGKSIIWERGQALGMYPSFGLFTMTHGVLLYALNGNIHDNKFFVLGDDMIILDAALAQKYQDFLSKCDIPFSKEKSIASNSIAEFAGKLYTGDKVKVMPKWKPINKLNCLDTITNWGQSIIPMFPKKHQKILYLISQLPQPYGCGFNPKGLTIDQRFEGFEDMLISKEQELEYSTDTRSLVMKRILHNTDLRLKLRMLFPNINLADKTDKELSERLEKRGLFLIKEFLPIFGKNLYYQDPNLNLPLGGKAISSSRKSSRFMKILKDFAQKVQ